MARVWQRLTVTLVSSLGVTLLLQCNFLAQKPGDKCTSSGKFACTDSTNALLCQSGTIVAMSCRGPHGCTGVGSSSQCDDDLAVAGEPCLMGAGGENYACTMDKKAELVCTAGKWVVNSTCKGPGSCAVTGNMVHCDDDFADIGDPCVSNASDANYSCTPDKRVEVVCKANKFVEAQGCLGPKGCHIENSNVYCDITMANVGDMCRQVDSRSCTTDGKTMTRCTAQLRWAAQQSCPHNGCRFKGGGLYCD